MALRRLRRSPTVATIGIALVVLVATRTYGLWVQLCHCDQSRLGRERRGHQLLTAVAESDQTVNKRTGCISVIMRDNDGINISGSIIFSIESRVSQ